MDSPSVSFENSKIQKLAGHIHTCNHDGESPAPICDVTNDAMKHYLNIIQLNFGVIRAIRTGTYMGENWGYTKMVGLES